MVHAHVMSHVDAERASPPDSPSQRPTVLSIEFDFLTTSQVQHAGQPPQQGLEGLNERILLYDDRHLRHEPWSRAHRRWSTRTTQRPIGNDHAFHTLAHTHPRPCRVTGCEGCPAPRYHRYTVVPGEKPHLPSNSYLPTPTTTYSCIGCMHGSKAPSALFHAPHIHIRYFLRWPNFWHTPWQVTHKARPLARCRRAHGPTSECFPLTAAHHRATDVFASGLLWAQEEGLPGGPGQGFEFERGALGPAPRRLRRLNTAPHTCSSAGTRFVPLVGREFSRHERALSEAGHVHGQGGRRHEQHRQWR